MSASLQRNPGGSLRRFGRLARAELGFAARYGILPLYGVIAVIYLALLSAITPAARPSAGGVIALTTPTGGPAQLLYLIDTRSKAFAIYRVDPTNAKGAVKLEAARQYQWDLKLADSDGDGAADAASEL